MRSDGNIVRGFEIPTFSDVWEAVRDWAERALTSEKKAEAALTSGTLALMGYVAFVMCQGLEHYTIGPF